MQAVSIKLLWYVFGYRSWTAIPGSELPEGITWEDIRAADSLFLGPRLYTGKAGTAQFMSGLCDVDKEDLPDAHTIQQDNVDDTLRWQYES